MENPLQSYYRHKEIFVKLPTKAKWMSNPPELTPDGEIGVRPMTVSDELLLTIPDALYNGESMFNLIESVCPDMGDAREIMLPDVDVILLASRATSFEKTFPVSATCTHCEANQMFDIDLQSVLGKVTMITEETEVEIDGLVVEMRPNSLKALTASNIKGSETARLLASIKGQEDLENINKKEEYVQGLQQIAAANIVLVADAIIKVTMPDGNEVTDTQHIIDWLSNTNRKTLDVLTNQQRLMNTNGRPKIFDFTCGEEDCAKVFNAEVEFNPSFFFTKSFDYSQPLKTSTN